MSANRIVDTSEFESDFEDEISGVVEHRPVTDNEVEEAYTNISFRVIYQNNNYFLPQIHDLIEKRDILNIRPEYQRRLRWAVKQKSLLVESLLLNIPIPPVYLYESDLARYEVMDGQQRLNAIYEFLSNGFALSGLEKLSFLNGKRYSKLPPKVKRGLDRASISAIVLLQETKSDQSDPFLVRRYVFERLNTGGQRLNPQELRNCIYTSYFNKMIIDLTRDPLFCEQFGIPPYTETDENEFYENPERQSNTLYKTMADCQIVLRFFALLDDEYIKGSMKNILDDCMDRSRNIKEEDIPGWEAAYKVTLGNVIAIFGENAFVLHEDGTSKKARASVALYDAIMVACYRLNSRVQDIYNNRDKVRAKIVSVLSDASNREMLTGRANTAQSIKDRIDLIVNSIQECI